MWCGGTSFIKPRPNLCRTKQYACLPLEVRNKNVCEWTMKNSELNMLILLSRGGTWVVSGIEIVETMREWLDMMMGSSDGERDEDHKGRGMCWWRLLSCGLWPISIPLLWKKKFFVFFLKKILNLFFPLLAHHFVCEKESYIEDIIKNQTQYF